MKNNDLLRTTKAYYDSLDADHFYHQVWGSEDIHIGIYESPDEDIFTASQRTVQRMASMLEPIDEGTKAMAERRVIWLLISMLTSPVST